jgi:hypothetical protein
MTERKIRVFIGEWVEGVVVDEYTCDGYTAFFRLHGHCDLQYEWGDLARDDGVVVYLDVSVFFDELDVDSIIKLRAAIPGGLQKLEEMVKKLSDESHIHVRAALCDAHRHLLKFKPNRVFDFTIAAHQIWAFALAIQDGDHAIKSRVFGFLWQF